MNTILTTLLTAATLCAVPYPVQQRGNSSPAPSPSSSPTTSENTAEGAEILRRILVDSLDKAFTPADKDKDEGATRIEGHRMGIVSLFAGRDTIQHSRVFHMPDVGLFFALDAALPVVSKEEKRDTDGKGSEKAHDDEWERARRELRGDLGGNGGFTLLRNHTAKEVELDPKAIDQVIDIVLRTLARHTGRVEGLGSRETITIALRLSGRGRAFWNDDSPDAQVWSGYDVGEGEGEGHAEGGGGAKDGDGLAQAYSFVLASGASVHEQNLVIRIALADLAAGADADVGRLRDRAQINRY
jgi:hypothetical protein